MSMPFNVVAFTSTVLAFFFGSLFNLTYSTTADIIKRSQQSPASRIRGKLQAMLERCKRTVKAPDSSERDAARGRAEEGAEAADTQQPLPARAKVTGGEEAEEKKEVVEQLLHQAAAEAMRVEETVETEAETDTDRGADGTTRRRKVDIGTHRSSL